MNDVHFILFDNLIVLLDIDYWEALFYLVAGLFYDNFFQFVTRFYLTGYKGTSRCPENYYPHSSCWQFCLRHVSSFSKHSQYCLGAFASISIRISSSEIIWGLYFRSCFGSIRAMALLWKPLPRDHLPRIGLRSICCHAVKTHVQIALPAASMARA